MRLGLNESREKCGTNIFLFVKTMLRYENKMLQLMKKVIMFILNGTDPDEEDIS